MLLGPPHLHTHLVKEEEKVCKFNIGWLILHQRWWTLHQGQHYVLASMRTPLWMQFMRRSLKLVRQDWLCREYRYMAYKAAEMLNIIAKALDPAGFCHKNGLMPSINKTCNSCSCCMSLSFNSKGFSYLNIVDCFTCRQAVMMQVPAAHCSFCWIIESTLTFRKGFPNNIKS